MNVITFDIEEWALAKAGGYGSPELYARYDVFLNRILDSLDDARSDTFAAVDALEQCIGRKVTDYRAPAFSIGDLLPELNGIQSRADFEAYYKIPGTFRSRAVRYLKSNFGKKRAMGKLLSLLGDVHFISMSQADSLIDWETAPIVK